MIYYKVVRKFYDGKYYSATAHPYYRLRYGINLVTKPKIKGSKLLVFDNKKSAIEFALSMNKVSLKYVFMCEVTNPQPCPIISMAYASSIYNFWKTRMYEKVNEMLQQGKTVVDIYNECESIELPLCIAPNNTIACDSVMLLRKVKI